MGGGDAEGAAFDVGKGVEAFDGLVDSFGASGATGGDDDEGCAGEEDGGGGVEAYAAGASGVLVEDTEWQERRVPPVTRAILLSRLKREAMGGRSDMLSYEQSGIALAGKAKGDKSSTCVRCKAKKYGSR